MLSVFPDLLTFGLIAPAILRVVVGLFFVNFGWSKLGAERETKAVFFETVGLKPGRVFVIIFGLLELIGGLFLIAGFLTQVVALVFAAILIGVLVIKQKQPAILAHEGAFYLVLFIISLSLLLSGAGAFAFDLPL